MIIVMRKFLNNYGCIECDTSIDERVFRYSVDIYFHPLCRSCQQWFDDVLEYTSATDHAINLYFALKVRGVPATLEKVDGYKSIDIAVPCVKVNIEVDGMHHAYNGRQALTDLRRTLHSFRKGYSTLRIPNVLTEYDIEQTADLITEYLIASKNLRKTRYY